MGVAGDTAVNQNATISLRLEIAQKPYIVWSVGPKSFII